MLFFDLLTERAERERKTSAGFRFHMRGSPSAPGPSYSIIRRSLAANSKPGSAKPSGLLPVAGAPGKLYFDKGLFDFGCSLAKSRRVPMLDLLLNTRDFSSPPAQPALYQHGDTDFRKA